ncbi:MAG: DcaP family trimeric outer membrane transporter [Allosphingosinicella sp.]
MHDGAIALTLLLAGAPAPAPAAEPAVAAEAAPQGESQELKELRARVDALEAELRGRREQEQAQAAAAPPPAARPPNPGNHSLELYGFAQVDAIQDFKRVNPDWDATLRPSRIPTTEGEFGSDGQSVFSARQSRLGAKASGEIGGKPYEAKVEFDLYGVGVDAGQTTIRLRHAYGRWGPFLAGQTNTLFMDGDIFPNTVDYWGPAGMAFVRNPQLRFYLVDSPEWKFAVALEHPSDDIDPGQIRLVDPELATNLHSNEELPDLTMMARYQGDWGHIQLAGLARKIGYDTHGTPDNKPAGSEFGWGLDLTGVAKWSLATFRLGVVYGEGIATYMNDGGMDLAPRAALVPTPPIFPPPPSPPLNELVSARAVPLLGISAYVDLQWTPHWTSAIGYSFTEVNNTNFQDGTAFHKGEYASANLLWAPDPRLLTGLEVLWGRRTDNNGNQGDDVRAQFSFKVSFSSKDLWGG